MNRTVNSIRIPISDGPFCLVGFSTLTYGYCADHATQTLDRTDFAPLQSVSLGKDERRVRAELSDEHRERAAGDVRVVELDGDVVDAVLLGHEAHRVLVLVQLLAEHVLFDAGRRLDDALQRPERSVQVHVERGRLLDLNHKDPSEQ